MDSDIKYIIQEEQKLVHLAEESEKTAMEKIEQHRVRTEEIRKSGLSAINAEYSSKLKMKLDEIKERMKNELKEMRIRQERILGETELRNKITRNIISLILEARR
jgi:hypothetical protein